LVVIAAGAVATAQQAPPAGPFISTGTVTGRVHLKNNDVISNAKVRLRDVRSGRIAGETRTNGVGDFTFEAVDRGLYVPEVVTEAGRAIAAGEAFSLEAGQTVSIALSVESAAALTAVGGSVAGFASSTGHAAATAAGAVTTAVGAVTGAVSAVSSATSAADTPAPPVSGEK
jgi:hypothetical protein